MTRHHLSDPATHPAADVIAEFAGRLRALRLAAGLTQENLSDATGMGAAEISRLERAGRDPHYKRSSASHTD